MTDACPLHPGQPRPCAPCGVARVRAALAAAPRPAHARDPRPAPTDLAATRQRADHQENS